jgi:hypothetical protein
MENELYPGHAEELRRREELSSRLDRAHAAVLPGALREAFGGEPVMAEGHKLQPVTLGLTANLERIKSPLLEIVRIMREEFSRTASENPEGINGNSPGLQSGVKDNPSSCANHGEAAARSANLIFDQIKQRVSQLKFAEEQIAETCFVFVCPQKRVRQLLDAGRDKFRETAMEELGDKLHPAQMAALQRACAQHYVASFATIIGYGTPPPEDGAVVFRQPSPGAVTGSVGG